MSSKRKASTFDSGSEAMQLHTSDKSDEKKPRKTASKPRTLVANDPVKQITWPDHFQMLFKVFKALNTVIAFVWSKRQLAVSFSAIRTTVEGVLKQPLEITNVAEIKALLPDLVRFAYIPRTELQADEINADHHPPHSKEDNVLVFDFGDNSTAKRTGSTSKSNTAASMSSSSVKKLIESRNNTFRRAIEDLISATPSNEDPVTLLVTAGQSYVPTPFHSHNSSTSHPVIPASNDQRPTVDHIISLITSSAWYKDQIVYRHSVEAKSALISLLDPPLSQTITDAIFKTKNVQSLYSHQAAAINAIRRKRHVVVSTSTASGKSIIYQIPILSFLEDNPDATAILVFPTKALAQDQKASLGQLFQMSSRHNKLKVETYDGDTPLEIRTAKEIRETGSVILTNFDTIHASILPNEEKWRSFLQRLQILVVDELHYYSGLLGSHVAQILRRFRRICAAVGNTRIRFVSCSATLSNPSMYMSRMFSLDPDEVDVVENDGAPSGIKEYLVWNPPLLDPTDSTLGRRSSLWEASTLMRFLMKEGMRVILFCKIRKVCELVNELVSNTLFRTVDPGWSGQVTKTVKADLANEGRLDIVEKVKAYRGGYSWEDRRRIEHDAFSGRLLGIIATNALELGIDIGALDAVIMLGFPMTKSNFMQQAGRAGRRSRDSLAVMVADPYPIDQYFVDNPTDLFDRDLDDIMIDIDNELVLEDHVQCAAHEIPLCVEDEKWFGPLMPAICERALSKDKDGWYHPHPKYLPFPSRHVSIRGIQDDIYLVVEVGNRGSAREAKKLEEVEVSRALFELYEGGVFMHQGDSYIITGVSHNDRIAKAIRSDVNYITSPRDLTRVQPLQTIRTKVIDTNVAQFGRINVYVKVFGFFKISGKTILDAVELETPAWERETIGFWVDLPPIVMESLREAEVDSAAAIHAAEHAFLNQFLLSRDVKTDCRVAKENDGDTSTYSKPYGGRYPRLIFYDAAGKTGGVVSRAYDQVQKILSRARTVVDGCGCLDGCQHCVQSATCKDANLLSSKLGASLILNGLLGGNNKLHP